MRVMLEIEARHISFPENRISKEDMAYFLNEIAEVAKNRKSAWFADVRNGLEGNTIAVLNKVLFGNERKSE